MAIDSTALPATSPGFRQLVPSQLAGLRALFTEAGYTASGVCSRAGIESIYDFRSRREGRPGGEEIVDRLDLLMRLFMDVEIVDRRLAEGLLSDEQVRLLQNLGLVVDQDSPTLEAAVLVYPTEGLWIASDLNVSPAGPAHTVLPDDAVYPAITKNTRHFLASLPRTPCEDFLELCGGTGIGALVAGARAGRAWSADITERATSFARFNAALNGRDNVTVVRGDLYEAVPGLTFDRIVAHPPYMPSLEQKYIFRDGGEDGEQITRRIIAGLPGHLRPGGRFHCTCMMTDRASATAEQRIRAMLGERHVEFDVLLVTERIFAPTEYYFRMALTGRAELGEVVQRHEVFRRLEVEHLVYGSMVIRRVVESRPVFTARRLAGEATGPADVEWLLHWEAASVGTEADVQLATARPTVSPTCRLRLNHVRAEGEWRVEECVLSTGSPFALEAKCPPWTAAILAGCDGRTTVPELHGRLQGSGSVPAALREAEFARFVRSLISGGFLRLAPLLDTV